jgi:hypothetical protein
VEVLFCLVETIHQVKPSFGKEDTASSCMTTPDLTLQYQYSSFWQNKIPDINHFHIHHFIPTKLFSYSPGSKPHRKGEDLKTQRTLKET